MTSGFQIVKQGARIIPGLLLLLTLIACVETSTPDQAVDLSDRGQAFDGAVTILAPAGYCLDVVASKPAAEPPVFIFASCRALGGNTARPPSTRAILTATVMPGPLPLEAGEHAKLLAFFQTQKGQNLISHTLGSGVSVLRNSEAGDAYFWLLAKEERAMRHFSPWIWFGLTEISGHGVSFAVYPAADQGDADVLGQELFTSFIERLAPR